MTETGESRAGGGQRKPTKRGTDIRSSAARPEREASKARDAAKKDGAEKDSARTDSAKKNGGKKNGASSVQPRGAVKSAGKPAGNSATSGIPAPSPKASDPKSPRAGSASAGLPAPKSVAPKSAAFKPAGSKSAGSKSAGSTPSSASVLAAPPPRPKPASQIQPTPTRSAALDVPKASDAPPIPAEGATEVNTKAAPAPPPAALVPVPKPQPAPGIAEKSPAAIDLERLTAASTGFLAESGKAGAAMLKALEKGERASLAPDETVDIAKTLGSVAEYWLKDPTRLVAAQKNLSLDMINLWQSMLRQSAGEPEPEAKPAPKDSRFADPEWTENPYFNFIRQAYVLGSRWASDLVEGAENLDDHTRRKARFYIRQLAGALSPSNFVMTNPELLRTTLEEHGENLARGMKMLAEDIEAGKGELKIRQTDAERFKVGENLATTPGKVVFRNELIELIQYSPTTQTVYKRPLLIVPPWINKFYILDLNPEKSFIRWAVSEGLTVFVISWVNPDARHRAYDWEAYMRQGILTAIKAIEDATGEKDVNAIGYCVGGTLLGVTLAWLAQEPGPMRIASATFFTTQVDFTHAGELLAFVDEAQIASTEEIMERFGYLPGEKMASAFNMLRPNDLIWSYMVNNYLKGKQPAPFDLLYWNSDSTRMAEANHSFYLRNCYLKNKLARGEMEIGGRLLDLAKVTIPIYNLAAKEDHIAPAKSVFVGSKLFGGPVTYVMAGSGHIAGVVNPVSKPKYQYWTGGTVAGQFEEWVTKARENPGTWWPHWLAWVTKDDARVPARVVGSGKLKPIEDAPGSYVRMKS
jgi:polyhydroxyalkanoate synthase